MFAIPVVSRDGPNHFPTSQRLLSPLGSLLVQEYAVQPALYTFSYLLVPLSSNKDTTPSQAAAALWTQQKASQEGL
jgi:hypothetical protein